MAGVGGFDFNGAISSLECLKCSLVSGAQVGSDGMKWLGWILDLSVRLFWAAVGAGKT